MSAAFPADVAAGRISSPHPGELRLLIGGAAYPGETVIMYRVDYAPAPPVTCAICEGRQHVHGAPCAMCDGHGQYRNPGVTPREIARHELSRYVVRDGDHWRAPDLCSGFMYYVVLVDDAREEPPLEWDHLQRHQIV